jgi:hypothetical protein
LNKAGFDGYNPTAEYHTGQGVSARSIEVGALSSEGYTVDSNDKTQYLYSAPIGDIQETGYVSFNVVKKTEDVNYFGAVEVKVYYAEPVSVNAVRHDGDESRGTTSIDIYLTKDVGRFVSVKVDGSNESISNDSKIVTINNRVANKFPIEIRMEDNDLPEGYYFSDSSQTVPITKAIAAFEFENVVDVAGRGTVQIKAINFTAENSEIEVSVGGIPHSIATPFDIENKGENASSEYTTIVDSNELNRPNGYYIPKTVTIVPAQNAIEVVAGNGETGKIGTTAVNVKLVSNYNGEGANSPQVTIDGSAQTILTTAEKSFPITNKGLAGKSKSSVNIEEKVTAANGYYIPKQMSISKFIPAVDIVPAVYHSTGGYDLTGFEVRNKEERAVAYVFGTRFPEMITTATPEIPSMTLANGTSVVTEEFVSLSKANLQALADTLNGLDSSYKTRIETAIEKFAGEGALFSRANIISFQPIDNDPADTTKSMIIGATFKFGINGDKSPNGYNLKDITIQEVSLGRTLE